MPTGSSTPTSRTSTSTRSSAGRRAPCWCGAAGSSAASSSACSTTGIITAQTTIAHLFRTFYRRARQEHLPAAQGRDGWAYQGFNWPAAWGGQYKAQIEHLDGEARKQVYADLGGTNTPKRKLWQKQMAAGRRGGYYHTYQGQVQEVLPGDGGTVITRISGTQGTLEIPANFIVDATGLEADIREHRVLADLFDHTGTGANPLGRLDVDRSFEIIGTRSDPGRMYAVGSSTLGGPYAGVDTFLGLQYAALRVTDDLAAQGFCPRSTWPGRSPNG